jgi:hypothetical protein
MPTPTVKNSYRDLRCVHNKTVLAYPNNTCGCFHSQLQSAFCGYYRLHTTEIALVINQDDLSPTSLHLSNIPMGMLVARGYLPCTTTAQTIEHLEPVPTHTSPPITIPVASASTSACDSPKISTHTRTHTHTHTRERETSRLRDGGHNSRVRCGAALLEDTPLPCMRQKRACAHRDDITYSHLTQGFAWYGTKFRKHICNSFEHAAQVERRHMPHTTSGDALSTMIVEPWYPRKHRVVHPTSDKI